MPSRCERRCTRRPTWAGCGILTGARLLTRPGWPGACAGRARPLNAAQLASIGWQNRQGVGDAGNQFHYYRLTADNRILWGGYDAVYYYGGKIAARLDQRPATFAALAEHFNATFPQLDGIAFTHSWGGVIDTCSRFCAFFGTAKSGRLAYVAGYN